MMFVTILSRIQIQAESEVNNFENERRREPAQMEYVHEDATNSAATENEEGRVELKPRGPAPDPVQTFVRDGRKVGRNEACPCGSGKKYKQCHGKL